MSQRIITIAIYESGERASVDVTGAAADAIGGIHTIGARRAWVAKAVEAATGKPVARIIAVTGKRGLRNNGFTAFVELEGEL